MDLRTVGKYQIVESIGRGAMGEVFRATDPVLGRAVAIKMLAPQMGSDPEMRRRFEREAQSAARLNHPNLITVYELGDESGRVFIAMELLDGADLKDLIGSSALATLGDKLRIMEQVLDGLAFAHRFDVVHRDLKPANIRVLPNGQVKVMDFGLARLSGSDMTQAGLVMGTPHYMSPEQVRGDKADARSDVFALGATFYELLTGQKAFAGENLQGILQMVLRGQPPALASVLRDLPRDIAAVIERALEKEPTARFASAGEMREALRVARVGLPAGALTEASTFGRKPWSAGRGTRSVAVSGTAALATAEDSQPATLLRGPLVPQARTLPGSASATAHVAPGRGRVVAVAAVGVLVLLGLGLFGWRALRPGAEPGPSDATTADRQAVALREALLDSRIELARLSLANKAYAEAVQQAQQALEVDPRSTAAHDVLARARAALHERDQVIADGRSALARNDVPRASAALARLLVLDPRHPAASEWTQALNASFRSQAEQAGGEATRARTTALAQGAGSQEGFAEGERLTREAEGALRAREFAVATQKLLLARDAYARAGRAGDLAARRQAEVLAQERLAAERAASARASARPAEARSAEPVLPRMPPPTQAAPPAPAAPSGPALTAPPAGVPAPPVSAEGGGAAREAALRQVIAEYAHAIASKDVTLFRSVKPNLTAQEQKRLEDAFKAIKSQQVTIRVEQVQWNGSQALVRVARQDTLDGKPARPIQQTFRMVETPAGWKIDSIGQ